MCLERVDPGTVAPDQLVIALGVLHLPAFVGVKISAMLK